MLSKIVITSVGSLVGQNILDALEGRRSNLQVIGTNSLAEAPGNFRCDQAFLVPPFADREACKEKLLQLIGSERPDLIIPGRDDDVLLLSELAHEWPGLAAHVLVGCPEIARMMDDKVASHAYAIRHGLPFVATVASAAAETPAQLDKLLLQHAFPLIAKPRSGNGSRGIRILLNHSQLQRIAARPGFAIQPMIDPPAELSFDLEEGLPFFWGVTDHRLYGAQCLIDRQGRVTVGLGFCSTMIAGRCERMQRCDDPHLLDAAARYAQRVAESGWRGPLNLQFKLDSAQGYLAIELNGRFSGGTSARAHLGYDEVRECLDQWLGGGTVPGWPGCGRNEAVYKSLSDFPLPEEARRQLVGNGVWGRT